MARVGSLAFVLHAHLPYVLAHGRWPHGTDWLNEAAAETYLPLLRALDRLLAEGLQPRLTIGITPVLSEMLADRGFAAEFEGYLAQKIEAAEADQREFARVGDAAMQRLAERWEGWYRGIRDEFVGRYGRDLVGAFRRLQDAGAIEILTSAATHGYLPLLGEDTSVQAQIKQGVATYRRHFGRPPRGAWLPECAYRPRYRWQNPVEEDAPPRLRKGIDEFLAENGIEYFVIDSHLLKGGRAIGIYIDRFEALKRLWEQYVRERGEALRPEAPRSPYDLFLVASKPDMRPVAVFTRDPRTALQVWSGQHGYPGDGCYLDFHKKRFPGGLRYWRVTDAKADLADKQPYDPEAAAGRIAPQADHFHGLVKATLGEHRAAAGRPGVLTAPFDAELFGHWWFEGPEWLAAVLRRVAADPELELTTAGAALEAHRPEEVIALPEGSWGEGGHHWIWLNPDTVWTWRHVYRAERELPALLAEAGVERLARDRALSRVLRQAARELLLLEASDWQFLISTFSARDYAELRVARHDEDFRRLAAIARRLLGAGPGGLAPEEEAFVAAVEGRDRLFPDLDLAWWRQVEYPAA
ncbi:MAG TPA: 1,4-alpha-glucan branching protein domain-containing protein [Thermodesulfobacteriota bacterium]|nr:1,4-alpha-glucan branching protein domain-containing protein [Thermodesulfobacteriota bacterium]